MGVSSVVIRAVVDEGDEGGRGERESFVICS